MLYNTTLLIKEIQECSYDRNKADYFVNIIIEVINLLRTPYKLGKVQMGMESLCQMKVTLKQSYANILYDIPIAIIFTKNMPQEAPQFYIELSPGTIINKNNPNINPINNRIETNGLKTWQTYSKMTVIINEIKTSFSGNFPICKAPSNVQNSYQIQPPNTMYQQFQQPNTTDSSRSMLYNQGALSNRPGYMTNNQISTGFGNINNGNISSSYQAQMTPQQAQEACKNILLNEVMIKVEPKLKEETNKITQQKTKFMNYQKEFKAETEKINQYLMNTDRLTQISQDTIKEVNEEIAKTMDYINNNRSRQLTSTNCMEFISVGGEPNNLIISLLAKEAMTEEILSITKKAFEKQAIDYVEAIKFIRSSTRSLFVLKYQREQLIDSFSLQY